MDINEIMRIIGITLMAIIGAINGKNAISNHNNVKLKKKEQKMNEEKDVKMNEYVIRNLTKNGPIVIKQESEGKYVYKEAYAWLEEKNGIKKEKTMTEILKEHDNINTNTDIMDESERTNSNNLEAYKQGYETGHNKGYKDAYKELYEFLNTKKI